MKLFCLFIAVAMLAHKPVAQTLMKGWYGKNGEYFSISADTATAALTTGDLKQIFDFKLTGRNQFALGEVGWTVTSDTGRNGTDRLISQRFVTWCPFNIVQLSKDTLTIAYASSKRLAAIPSVYFTFFSHKRFLEIKNPVFISLQYEMSGYHVFIDSSGYAEYWFDAPNTLKLPPGKKVAGKLSAAQMKQVRHWFADREMQDLYAENLPRTPDGAEKKLLIKAIPKDIHIQGNLAFPEEIRSGLIKFLSNINDELQ